MAASAPTRPRSRFVIVSLISYALNSFWVWLLFTHLHLGRAAPIVPMLFVTPAGHLLAQPPMGFPLMERVVYEQMAELDQRHWWYRARREVLAALIRRDVNPPSGAHILEIGCGTGHNLAMLGQFGNVDALELDEEARAIAEKRLGRTVMSAPLPELAGVPERALRPRSARST